MKKVRIDKWLWSVRLFKTRTKATNACKAGRVKINDKQMKPSALLEGDELINLRKESFDLIIKVVDLIDRRVSATLAEPCYENLTPESELNKFKNWYVGKAAPERRERGAGRPTKRERRTIDDFKENWLEDWDEFE
ncbi:MAG: RNA-binding S4 domain-containing protein [Saprospiraceae bacterium]